MTSPESDVIHAPECLLAVSPSADYAPALAFRDVGCYPQAVAWFRHWLVAHPQDVLAHAHLAQVLSLNKQDEQAWGAMREALAIQPSLPLVQRNLARLLLKQGRLEPALHAAYAAWTGEGQDPENQVVLATICAARGLLDQAMPLLETALQRHPDYAEAYVNRAQIKLRQGDYHGALADVEKSLSIKPHLTQLWGLVGKLRRQLHDLPGAMDALEKALAAEPDHLENLVLLGECKRQAGQVEGAVVLLQHAVTLAPDHDGAWVTLGVSLQQAGRIPEAGEAYQKALAINPQQAEVANNLGVMAKENHLWEEALRHFDHAFILQPTHVNIMVNRACALHALGRHGEAEQAARRVVEASPDHIAGYLVLSDTLTSQKRYEESLLVLNGVAPRCIDMAGRYGLAMAYTTLFCCRESWCEAEQWARRALALKPGQGGVLCKLGEILDEQQRYPEALTVYEQALLQLPGDVAAMQAMAVHYSRQKRWGETEVWLSRVLALQPDCAEALNNLGATVFQKQGRIVEAETSYRRAVALKPDFLEAHVNLGNTLQGQGRFEEAESCFRRALAIQPDAREYFTFLAINAYLQRNYSQAVHYIEQARPILDSTEKKTKNSRIYLNYLHRLLCLWQDHAGAAGDVAGEMHVMGESHCLAAHDAIFETAWGRLRCYSHLVMGIKMWHLAQPGANSHKQYMIRHIASLPQEVPVMFTIGEIDCRPDEGLWKNALKQGEAVEHGNGLSHLIENTVTGYLGWIETALQKSNINKVIIQGIPAPHYFLGESVGEVGGFLWAIQRVNQRLMDGALDRGWHFLDVYAATRNRDGLGNGRWHLDNYHLTPGFYAAAFPWLNRCHGRR